MHFGAPDTRQRKDRYGMLDHITDEKIESCQMEVASAAYRIRCDWFERKFAKNLDSINSISLNP